MSRSLQQLWTLCLLTPIPALAMLMIGFDQETRTAWQWTLLAITLWGFLAWWLSELRRRVLANTPSVRIAAAPQGYVRLTGTAQAIGQPLTSPSGGLPCVWYRQIVEERERRNSRRQYRHVDTDESDDSFLLVDSSDEVILSPAESELDVSESQVYYQGDYRITEWVIPCGQAIFALGEFRTRRAEEGLNLRHDLSVRLAEWKQDPHQLRNRFDRDRDGQISMEEWEEARRAAEREILQEHRELTTAEPSHFLHKPADLRPCLISTRDANSLLWRYRLARWLHILTIILALHGLYYLSRHPAWLPFVH